MVDAEKENRREPKLRAQTSISEDGIKTDPSLVARTPGILRQGEGNRAQPLCSLHGHTPGSRRLQIFEQEIMILAFYHGPKVLECASQRPLSHN